MSEMSVFNVGGLAKPVTTFIEKVSNAVGTLWEPHQIRRVAQAQADAALTLAQGDIEVTELQRRAAQRFVDEETRRQTNMETIAGKAISMLNPHAVAEKMEDDWIANFFDKCRIVSDADIQDLWSRVLAGEANNPGSFSRKTVNLLSDLDKASAELFVNLCSFGWNIDGNIVPMVFEFGSEIYQQHGIHLDAALYLSSIGLVEVTATGFQKTGFPKHLKVSYHDRQLNLAFEKESDNELAIGSVTLTLSGSQLATIVESKAVNGFFEFVYDKWNKQSLVQSGAAF